MAMNDSKEKTKQSFEQAFREKNYYEKQTRDEVHLQKIFSNLVIHEDNKILDLGTGTGYLAIPLAWNNPNATVIGLDLIESTMHENQIKAQTLHLPNLSYQTYDGELLPFNDKTFDVIVSRFALHHFTNIKKTFSEIKRVLKPGGIFFLSDPTPNPQDTEGFVDQFMQIKDDGHIKFYTKKEFSSLARHAGLYEKSCFMSEIRFPSKYRTDRYLEMAPSFDPEILESYHMEVLRDEVYITQQVLNMTFVNL